jgi:hypothetical protein
MRVLLLILVSMFPGVVAVNAQSTARDPCDALKSLTGDWRADLAGYGRMTSSIRLVSNGTAVEETIGTPADNEVSLYTRDGRRILLTHFCALTPGGHQVRLATPNLSSAGGELDFGFRDAINLSDASAPHMRRVLVSIANHDHFTERWTKTENGQDQDTVFGMHFVRR